MLEPSARTRGNVLIFVLVALAILAIVGMAAVEFTGRDLGIARTMQHRTAVERCAAAAKRWALAEFRRSGSVTINQGQQLVISLDGAGQEDKTTLLYKAHYGGSLGPLPSHPQAQSLRPVTEITNALPYSVNNTSTSNASVLCRDGNGREFEFEYYIQPQI